LELPAFVISDEENNNTASSILIIRKAGVKQVNGRQHKAQKSHEKN
jgi:hypothetical protein